MVGFPIEIPEMRGTQQRQAPLQLLQLRFGKDVILAGLRAAIHSGPILADSLFVRVQDKIRKTKGGMNESEIQKQITDFLKLKGWIVFKHRNVGIYKQSTRKYIPLAFGEKGISDIIGCSPEGRFGAIEVKKKGGKPSPEQLEFLERVRQKGGIGILAYSLDDVMERI